MNIDYGHLREWLGEVDQVNCRAGDTIEFSYPGSAVEIVRELLRLRDGVAETVESKRASAGVIREHVEKGFLPEYCGYLAAMAEVICDDLTNLLDGGDE